MGIYRFSVLQVFLFDSISDHEFYASKVWVEETIDNVASKDMWIYGANSIHLAAKFMPQGLELLLSSLDDNSGLVDMKLILRLMQVRASDILPVTKLLATGKIQT